MKLLVDNAMTSGHLLYSEDRTVLQEKQGVSGELSVVSAETFSWISKCDFGGREVYR